MPILNPLASLQLAHFHKCHLPCHPNLNFASLCPSFPEIQPIGGCWPYGQHWQLLRLT